MKVFTGKVISTKMEKTAKVAVERIMAHPVYKKRVKRTTNYLVHDEMGAKDGQQVRFVACKPYSKMKRWKIIEIVGVKKQSEKSEKKDVVKKEASAENKKVVKKATKTVKKAPKKS
jgi:small subunit ribosomal protein S17